MTVYSATAISEGDYWVIDIAGVGTAHAESFDDIENMAVALITEMTDADPKDVQVHVLIL
jgi:hypothetical protein